MSIEAGAVVRVPRVDGCALVLTDTSHEPPDVLIASVHPVGGVTRTGQDVEISADESPTGEGFIVALWNTRRALLSDLVDEEMKIDGGVLDQLLGILDHLAFGEEIESPRIEPSVLAALDSERVAEHQRQIVAQWHPVTVQVLKKMASMEAKTARLIRVQVQADSISWYDVSGTDSVLPDRGVAVEPVEMDTDNREDLLRCA